MAAFLSSASPASSLPSSASSPAPASAPRYEPSLRAPRWIPSLPGAAATLRVGALLALTATLAVLAPGAHAQVFGDRDPAAASSTTLGLGVAGAFRQRPYAGADRKNDVVPVLFVESPWFRLSGGAADLKLWRHQFAPGNSLEASARLKYEPEGYKAGDSPALAGMDKRKDAFLGGGALAWRTPWVDVGAEWVADLAGDSKGQKLSLQVEHRFTLGPLGVTPRAKAQWLDRKYVDYYFGVRAAEVLPGRALYLGEAATTAEAGVRVDYAIGRRHSVFIDASVTRLPDEIRQSPIVSRKDSSRLAVGYLYRF